MLASSSGASCLFSSLFSCFCHLSRARRPILSTFCSSDQLSLFNKLVAQSVGVAGAARKLPGSPGALRASVLHPRTGAWADASQDPRHPRAAHRLEEAGWSRGRSLAGTARVKHRADTGEMAVPGRGNACVRNKHACASNHTASRAGQRSHQTRCQCPNPDRGWPVQRVWSHDSGADIFLSTRCSL